MSNVQNNQTTSIGGSLAFLAGVVLVVLKLAGVAPVATWSWWAVTAPFWIGILVFLAVMVVVFGVLFLLRK